MDFLFRLTKVTVLTQSINK